MIYDIPGIINKTIEHLEVHGISASNSSWIPLWTPFEMKGLAQELNRIFGTFGPVAQGIQSRLPSWEFFKR